nr:hypothetical protein CFP56_72663 [Quercus suber]
MLELEWRNAAGVGIGNSQGMDSDSGGNARHKEWQWNEGETGCSRAKPPSSWFLTPLEPIKLGLFSIGSMIWCLPTEEDYSMFPDNDTAEFVRVWCGPCARNGLAIYARDRGGYRRGEGIESLSTPEQFIGVVSSGDWERDPYDAGTIRIARQYNTALCFLTRSPQESRDESAFEDASPAPSSPCCWLGSVPTGHRRAETALSASPVPDMKPIAHVHRPHVTQVLGGIGTTSRPTTYSITVQLHLDNTNLHRVRDDTASVNSLTRRRRVVMKQLSSWMLAD